MLGLQAQIEDRGVYEVFMRTSEAAPKSNSEPITTVLVGSRRGDRVCPPCDGVDFLYGVPFSLRIRAHSVVGYTYYRTALNQQTVAELRLCSRRIAGERRP